MSTPVRSIILNFRSENKTQRKFRSAEFRDFSDIAFRQRANIVNDDHRDGQEKTEFLSMSEFLK